MAPSLLLWVAGGEPRGRLGVIVQRFSLSSVLEYQRVTLKATLLPNGATTILLLVVPGSLSALDFNQTCLYVLFCVLAVLSD